MRGGGGELCAYGTLLVTKFHADLRSSHVDVKDFFSRLREHSHVDGKRESSIWQRWFRRYYVRLVRYQ